MFAAFPLDLALVPDPQMFMLPVQQPRLVQVLAERAGEYDVDIRWGHALAGFDQDADGVTVHVSGPDGPYELRAKYLVGADGGTSMTRKLAGIDFPGMSSHDVVARMGFDVLPPDEWVDPVSGGLDVPGFGRVPPLRFHRAERGVFACGALGRRAVVIIFELDRSAREDPIDDNDDATADEPGRTGGQRRSGCSACRRSAAARIARRAAGSAPLLTASTRGSRRGISWAG